METVSLYGLVASAVEITDSGHDEDPEAGELGKPFTQPGGFGDGEGSGSQKV